MEKIWNFLCDDLDRNSIAEMVKTLKISPVMAVLLLNRGVAKDDANDFLNVSKENLHDPFLMLDMDRAVERIKKAVENKEKITVYGDYDVDGITSVAMLVRYFKSFGVECDSYIPSREEEGYGLNSAAIIKIAKSRTKLIITVDTGITAIEEVGLATALGIDVIVTDHHTVGEKIPKAVAVLNPKREDCTYPFSELCGAGVTFKLLCALDGGDERIIENFVDLAAVAAIADIVPLKGENRHLAALGIKKLKENPNPGIAALMDIAAIDRDELSSQHISFGMAPRLNAAGRMMSADLSKSLLLEDDEGKALELAKTLNQTNEERRATGEQVFSEAVEQVESRGLKNKKVLVLHSHDWHPGIIGITASRIAELYHKTAILISVNEGVGQGSGRSVRGLNLYNAVSACEGLLTKFGGHDMAAGLTIDENKILQFDEEINRYADSNVSEEDLIPRLDVECRLSCDGPLMRLLDEIRILEPFGHENPRPIFGVMDCLVKSIKTSRDNKHLLMSVEKNNTALSAVGFGMGNRSSDFRAGSRVNMAVSPVKNTYGGKTTVQLRIADIKKA